MHPKSAHRRRMAFVLMAAVLLVRSPAGAGPADGAFDPAVFKDPPAEYRGHAMWGFNLSNVTEARIVAGIQDMAKLHLGGFFIETNGGSTRNLAEAYVLAAGRKLNEDGIEFHSDEFYRLYKLALEEARKHGLEVLLYDDYSFPTGTAGGQLYTKYPQHAAKSLEMVEKDATGPARVELAIPEGTYVGAVMMNRDTFELADVSDRRANDNRRLVSQVPQGRWKVMVFYLDHGSVLRQVWRKVGLVDYLDNSAMDAFLSLSYERFYAHLKEYFGNVIKMSFYDEPAMHLVNGRMWTPGFNGLFEKKYGYSPMKYYPALWYDIGPPTAAARNALYGFRAQLYADNFVKKLSQWCNAHGIQLAGHQDQEETLNPVPVHGDLMKVFEHQDVPGIDDIYYLGRSNVSYKIVTSAAFNYDKPVVLAETYAAYRKLDGKIAFQTAMDQYAMGVNFQVQARGRNEKTAELNRYVGRLSYLLRHGRHVADVAVVYPIASLQASYRFAGGGVQPPAIDSMSVIYALEGGVAPPEIDYMDLGEALYRGLRIDYTYLHPEVLESKCFVDRRKLILNNKENREEFSVLIVPGGSTLSSAAAKKVLEFYRSGGTVVATTRLPCQSAEFGRDREVQEAIGEVFGVPIDGPVKAEIKPAYDDFEIYFVNRNSAGGRAYFLPKADPKLLKTVLAEALPIRDVDIQLEMAPLKRGTAYDGALTYIHKVRNDRDIYFFANSSEKPVDTKVVLRGKKSLTIWNPHTGEREPAHAEAAGSGATEVRLALPPVSSLFYVQERQ